MIPLARVRNVRPTQLERRTITGAQISAAAIHMSIQPNVERCIVSLSCTNIFKAFVRFCSVFTGLLLEPDFHDVGTNTRPVPSQEKQTQTEGHVRA
eukprot:5400261-Pleurochrysis_carterae.AAC.1